MDDKGENEAEDEDEDDDDDDEEVGEDGKDFEKDKFLQDARPNNIEMIVSGVIATDYTSKESGKKKNKFQIYWSHYRKYRVENGW